MTIASWSNWRGAQRAPLREIVHAGFAGRRMVEIERAEDVEIVTRIDTFDGVPTLDPTRWELRLA